MFLAVREGVVVERSSNMESLLRLDQTTHELFEWGTPLAAQGEGERGLLPDPRTEVQKLLSTRRMYAHRRLRDYPSIREQLDMIYWDAVNSSTDWIDEITRIKVKHPKPTE